MTCQRELLLFGVALGHPGCHTYPVLPITPVTGLHLGVEHPSLAPEQHHHPHGDEQVREADQAMIGEVLAHAVRQREQRSDRHAAAALAPEAHQPAEPLGHEGAQVVEQRGGFLRMRAAVRGQVALPAIMAGHGGGLVQPCPGRCRAAGWGRGAACAMGHAWASFWRDSWRRQRRLTQVPSCRQCPGNANPPLSLCL